MDSGKYSHSRTLQNFRGDGTTTKQMKEAPKDAIYICTVGPRSVYYNDLKHKLGRQDLQLVSPLWLTDQRYKGLNLTGIVVDHAVVLDKSDFNSLLDAEAYIR